MRAEGGHPSGSNLDLARASHVRSCSHEQVASLQSAGTNAFPDPIAIEGVGRSLEREYNNSRINESGYSPRISVICPDHEQLHLSLAEKDWTHIISDPRVEWHIGESAVESFGAAMRSRLDLALPTQVLSDSPVQSRCHAALQAAIDSQRREAARLKARVAAMYPTGDRDGIAQKWSEIRSATRNARILLPATRFSTFTRHACSDLAAAFIRAGHAAQVMLEPDDFSRFSAVAYLRRFAEFRPDLVVMINYPRGSMGGEIPVGIPYACWIQDAMPHLFDAAVGRAQTDLDFLVGNLYAELFEKWNYPKKRLLPISVVADSTKFHPAPIDDSRTGSRVATIVAYVSHHSETPEAMHARLVARTAYAPLIQRVFENLWPRLRQTAADALEVAPISWAGVLAKEELARAIGHEPDDRTLTLVQRTYAMPIVDRLLRHEMLSWAADICRELGCTLAIHGRGWESHPTLSRHAAPPVDHGEPLRRLYASAALHLHCSATAIVHQRVLECFLSGGLCLCRITRDAASGPRTRMLLSLLEREPDIRDDAGGRIGYIASRHAESRRFNSLMQRLGIRERNETVWIGAAKRDSLVSHRDILAPDHDADDALGGLAEIAFSSRETLADLIKKAITDASRRRDVISRARDAILPRLTHDALAHRLLALMSDELSGIGGKR